MASDEGRLCRPLIIVADGMPQFIPEKHVPLSLVLFLRLVYWTIFSSGAKGKVYLHDIKAGSFVAKDVETTGRGRYVLCRLLKARRG